MDTDFFRQYVREKEGNRILTRFTIELATSIQLKYESSRLKLAPIIGVGNRQDFSNYVALEKWVARELAAGGLNANKAALEILSPKLKSKLRNYTA